MWLFPYSVLGWYGITQKSLRRHSEVFTLMNLSLFKGEKAEASTPVNCIWYLSIPIALKRVFHADIKRGEWHYQGMRFSLARQHYLKFSRIVFKYTFNAYFHLLHIIFFKSSSLKRAFNSIFIVKNSFQKKKARKYSSLIFANQIS